MIKIKKIEKIVKKRCGFALIHLERESDGLNTVAICIAGKELVKKLNNLKHHIIDGEKLDAMQVVTAINYLSKDNSSDNAKAILLHAYNSTIYDTVEDIVAVIQVGDNSEESNEMFEELLDEIYIYLGYIDELLDGPLLNEFELDVEISEKLDTIESEMSDISRDNFNGNDFDIDQNLN